MNDHQRAGLYGINVQCLDGGRSGRVWETQWLTINNWEILPHAVNFVSQGSNGLLLVPRLGFQLGIARLESALCETVRRYGVGVEHAGERGGEGRGDKYSNVTNRSRWLATIGKIVSLKGEAFPPVGQYGDSNRGRHGAGDTE